jgi:hypothetical protein
MSHPTGGIPGFRRKHKHPRSIEHLLKDDYRLGVMQLQNVVNYASALTNA